MASTATAQSVRVEIYDQSYNLRGSDAEYYQKLAEYVDAKMRAVAAHGTTVDSLRVAVLTALNIADQLFALRRRHESLTSDVMRANELEAMLDEVLELDRAG